MKAEMLKVKNDLEKEQKKFEIFEKKQNKLLNCKGHCSVFFDFAEYR